MKVHRVVWMYDGSFNYLDDVEILVLQFDWRNSLGQLQKLMMESLLYVFVSVPIQQ